MRARRVPLLISRLTNLTPSPFRAEPPPLRLKAGIRFDLRPSLSLAHPNQREASRLPRRNGDGWFDSSDRKSDPSSPAFSRRRGAVTGFHSSRRDGSGPAVTNIQGLFLAVHMEHPVLHNNTSWYRQEYKKCSYQTTRKGFL